MSGGGKTIFRNGLITNVCGSFEADIAVENGLIIDVGPDLKGAFDSETDLHGKRILPGCIDPHVHFALPVGSRRTADDFVTGSRKALNGGVTTVFDFSTPETGVSLNESVRKRQREAAEATCSVYLHATVCGWNASIESEALACLDMGVRSFKFFTTYEESGRRTGYEAIERAAAWAARHDARIIVHAEDQASLIPADRFCSDAFCHYEASRPVASEVAAIEHLATIRKRTGASIAIVHVSSGSGVEAARGSGLKLETCPHYLTQTRDLFLEQDGYRHAVAPPLRSAGEQALLWEALIRGDIDWIGSDHAPFDMAERDAAGDHFLSAPFGLAGVSTLLPIMIREGVLKKRIAWEQLVALTSENAARFYGIFPQKGCIAVGSAADLVVVGDDSIPSVLSFSSRSS